jgi:hypothetical protein
LTAIIEQRGEPGLNGRMRDKLLNETLFTGMSTSDLR